MTNRDFAIGDSGASSGQDAPPSHSGRTRTCPAYKTKSRPHGAGGAWRDEYAAAIVRAGCLAVDVVPDADKAGWALGDAAARSCAAAGLRVRFVPLPNLPPGGDIVDWLAAGYTSDDWRRVVADTPFETAEQARDAIKTARKAARADHERALWRARQRKHRDKERAKRAAIVGRIICA